jgi:hypothetical protein
VEEKTETRIKTGDFPGFYYILSPWGASQDIFGAI